MAFVVKKTIVMIQYIKTDKAPLPAGHYSQATVTNGMVFVAGQLPIVPGSKEKIPGPIADQARQVIENMRQVLLAADSDLDHVLRVTIYISDMELWGAVNDVYTKAFGDAKPARAIVPVKDLHYGYAIEMTAIAAVKA
jgi:2-iminobutanoate/2-iminopropanoate deaminase